MSLNNLRTLVIVAALVLAVPRLASACPVCFGAIDAPMLQGSNMGILALLLVTLAVLGAFGIFFRSLARHAQRAAHVTTRRTTAPPAAAPSEGLLR